MFFFSFQIYNNLEVLARYQVYAVESVTQEIASCVCTLILLWCWVCGYFCWVESSYHHIIYLAIGWLPLALFMIIVMYTAFEIQSPFSNTSISLSSTTTYLEYGIESLVEPINHRLNQKKPRCNSLTTSLSSLVLKTLLVLVIVRLFFI